MPSARVRELGHEGAPAGVRAARRNPRVVAAAVLTVTALLGLILTAMLDSRSPPATGEDGGPAAVSGAYEDRALP
ncbi:hypothetical protein ACFY8C_16665 [Streptomyces flavochromogenes]|jgi:hypothetical protein|uniref:Uncharacterized protein n=1 Tax=Streptomyces flavochromogenes TaxID=68199 RepID=A0ABW6XR16_9ACTN|nr:hypothetical protein [Streptomyces flavochromogenes]